MKMNKLSISCLAVSLLIFSCKKVDITNTPADIQTEPSNVFNINHRDAGGSTGGVTFECKSCLMTYPDSSNLPRSLAVFNENEVLVASDPGQTTCGTQPEEIKVWYADEHALCIGVRQVIIKTNTGTTVTNYAVSPTPLKSPALITNPLVGATDQSGDQSGNDVSVDGGRPLWPTLYITDITGNLKSRSGDWQQGGTAYLPTKIAGTWKSAVKTVDKTKIPNLVTVQMDADPSYTNANWNLGGGTLPPAGTRGDKYGAMVAWNINSLGLLSGHIYRVQFMVHDGDQNKTGGDVGQSCTTIIMP